MLLILMDTAVIIIIDMIILTHISLIIHLLDTQLLTIVSLTHNQSNPKLSLKELYYQSKILTQLVENILRNIIKVLSLINPHRF